MIKMDIVSFIKENKIVAISRHVKPEKMVDVAKALAAGGIKLLEITFDQSSSSCISDTAFAISSVKEAMGNLICVGAGTVLTVEQAEAAHEAGADFALSPDTNVAVINAVKRLGIVSVPGAFTPSEILTAWNAGADIVKLFPAGVLGMPYMKAIRGPISHVPLMAVGGVDENNVSTFLNGGFCSCGIGSNLVRNDLIEKDDYSQITAIAAAFVEASRKKDGKNNG